MPLKPAERLSTFRWVCAAISPLVGAETLRATQPSSDAAWDHVVNIASANLVMPSLYLALRDKGLLAEVPADLAQALEGVYTLNTLHNTRLRQQMLSVTTALNEVGIPPIWLKGATHLLASDWAQSGRMMLDLDLWIPDLEGQAMVLTCLEEAGYVIQPEWRAKDFSQTQHFAPRVKEGEPARLEVHRTIVNAQASALLPNDQALPRVDWLTWEGTKVGQLSAADRLMHSYIQCAEMNDLSLGRVALMKALDFVERAIALDLPAQPQAWMARVDQAPWQVTARQFLTFLDRDFGLPSVMAPDHRFLRTMDWRLTYPRSLYLADQVCTRLLTGRAGSPTQWWGKLDRYMTRLRQSEPGS